MREIPVIGHIRHLPDKPRLIDNAVHCELRLGVELVRDLESKLAGLLPDARREQIERMEQTY